MLFFGKQEGRHTCKQCQQKMLKAGFFTIDPDKLCYKKMKSIVFIFFWFPPPSPFFLQEIYVLLSKLIIKPEVYPTKFYCLKYL